MKSTDQDHEGDLFIGARLSTRRQKAGITIDKAAKDTRIPVSRLRQIEADDLSTFSHPTYARLFLIDYANYLQIPLEEIRDYLPGTTNLGAADNQYLNVLLEKPGFLQGEQFKSLRRLLIAATAGIAFLLLVVLGIYSWKTWKKFERVQPAPPLPASSTPPPTPAPTPEAVRIIPNSTPSPRLAPADPSASPTPFTLPPFQPSSRPKRPQ